MQEFFFLEGKPSHDILKPDEKEVDKQPDLKDPHHGSVFYGYFYLQLGSRLRKHPASFVDERASKSNSITSNANLRNTANSYGGCCFYR